MFISKLGGATRAVALAALWLFSGNALADWELNMPRGVTEISAEVYDLHMAIFLVCVVIAVVVFGAMIYSIFRHRKSKGATPASFHHSTVVEVIWTLIPFAILVAMAVPSAETLLKMEDYSKSDMTVKVTGYQWKWHYDYLDNDVEFFSSLDRESNRARQLHSGIDPNTVDNYLLDVDNPMVVPVGEKVRILLTANDVIHAWWVPQLGGKKDAIPGFINEWWFKADEKGTYRGQCAELCGRDHGFMPVVVKVVSRAEYEQWIREEGGTVEAESEAAPPTSADADETGEPEQAGQGSSAPEEEEEESSRDMASVMEQGKTIHQGRCAACHGTDGGGNEMLNAPALKDGEIATGPVDQHLDVVINGSPGTSMAPFGSQLSDEQIAAVVTYQRNAWGNETGDLVTPDDVRSAR